MMGSSRICIHHLLLSIATKRRIFLTLMMEELETEIEEILINGVDIIKFSDDGRPITHFRVMVRNN
jgi:hypothetical protein